MYFVMIRKKKNLNTIVSEKGVIPYEKIILLIV